MNVVIWARVSSREQREGYSIDAQLRVCREKASKAGWTVDREFVVAESAKRGAERFAFNEMFSWLRKQAPKQKIQAIVAHKLDRVCRNMRDAVRLQELEDECGIRLVFTDNQFGTGAAGALSFNVMAAVAQYYSDNLRTEVLKGMEEKVRQGWPMGKAAFGYKNVPDRSCPIISDPDKAPTLVRLFTLFATGKYTLHELAATLAKEGHTYRSTMPKFYRTKLSHILNNRIYVAEIVRKGVIYPGKFPPLISRTTFNACQDVLKGKNRRTGKPDLALSGGLFVCAHCGAAMSGERIRRKLLNGSVNTHVYYKCASAKKGADHPRVRWRENDLEEAVVRALDSMQIPNPEVARWLRDTLTAAFADATQAEAMRLKLVTKRQTELQGKMDRLLNVYLEGMVEEPVYCAKLGELKGELADNGRQLEDKAAWDSKRGALALAAFDFSQRAGEIWRRSKWDVRREILTALSSNRSLNAVSLVLVKRKPFDVFTEGPLLTNGWGAGIRTPTGRVRVCSPTVRRHPSRS